MSNQEYSFVWNRKLPFQHSGSVWVQKLFCSFYRFRKLGFLLKKRGTLIIIGFLQKVIIAVTIKA